MVVIAKRIPRPGRGREGMTRSGLNTVEMVPGEIRTIRDEPRRGYLAGGRNRLGWEVVVLRGQQSPTLPW